MASSVVEQQPLNALGIYWAPINSKVQHTDAFLSHWTQGAAQELQHRLQWVVRQQGQATAHCQAAGEAQRQQQRHAGVQAAKGAATPLCGTTAATADSATSCWVQDVHPRGQIFVT